MKLKRLIVFLLALFMILSKPIVAYANNVSALDRSKLMIAFYNYSNFSESDTKSLLEGAYDEEAVRLMGLFVSNWLKPGYFINISKDESNEDSLKNTIKSIITNKMNFPDEVAEVYAKQVAYNMIYKVVALDIYHTELSIAPKCYDASGKDYKIIYVDKVPVRVELTLDDKETVSYSYLDVGINSKSYSQSRIDNKAVSLNKLLLGSNNNYSGEVAYVLGSRNAGDYGNDLKYKVIKNGATGKILKNLDEQDVWIKSSGIRLVNPTTQEVVWDNVKTSCQFSGLIARNLIATAEDESTRVSLLGDKSKDANGSNLVFKSVASANILTDQRLLIDAFGNIYSSKGYIIIPACMNPYTFDSSGEKTILSNNFAIGYIYNTDNKSSNVRNSFDFNLNYTSIAVKRRASNGLYSVGFFNTSRSDFGSSLEWLKFVSEDTNPNSETSKRTINADWVEFIRGIYENFDAEVSNVYQVTLPMGLLEWQIQRDKLNGNWTANNKHTKRKGYTSFYNKDTAVIDLIRLGGTWSETGQWSTLIDTTKNIEAEKEIAALESIASITNKKTDDYGNIIFEDVQVDYIYGLYCLYATIILGEDIQYQTEPATDTSEAKYVTIPTSSWGASKTLPAVTIYGDLNSEITDIVMGSVTEAELTSAQAKITLFMADLIDGTTQMFKSLPRLINQRGTEILLALHYNILGLKSSTDNSALMGTVNYTADNGYVTIPELEDISWLSYLFDNYDIFLASVMLIISAIVIVYIIVGLKSIQRGILSVALFGFCLFLIPTTLSTVINFTNKASNSFVKDKFQYWVVTQQQSYIEQLNQAYGSGTTSTEIQAYLKEANEELIAFSNGSSAVVTLSWMTPKKDDYIGQILGDLLDTESSSTNSLVANKAIYTTMRHLANSTLSGQTFTDTDTGYLYRSYTDISMYAKMVQERLYKVVDYANKPGSSDASHPYYGYYDDTYNEAIYVGTDKEDKFSTREFVENYSGSDKLTRLKLLTINGAVSKAIKLGVFNDTSDFTLSDYKNRFGLNIDFSSDTSTQGNKFRLSNLKNLSDDELSTYQFLLYTESPFYYIFNSLADSGTMGTADYMYKNTLLKDGFLTSTEIIDEDGNMATRDYLDLKNFFRYVLPLMQDANDVVKEFDSKYGMEVYSEASTSLDYNTIVASEELTRKVGHNTAVKNMWNLYSPWLDVITDCDYSKPETFKTVLDGRIVTVTVEEPLNPESYLRMKLIDGNWIGRDMVFGEEDMIIHGLAYNQLSTVEKKIYNILENSKKDLSMLLNYFSYDNQVLTTAGAMSVLFNFNSEFTELNLLGEDRILVPQGYELKNFGYDAYLRMALINSTGMNVGGIGDMGVYAVIAQNTNMPTLILMIVNDFVATFILTYSKLAIVTLLVILGILSIISSMTVDDIKLIKTFKEAVIEPNIKLIIITLLHAYIASLLMGDVTTNVISDTNYSVSLNSPTLVIVALLILNCIVASQYIVIILSMVRRFVTLVKATVGSISGAIANIGTGVIKAIGTDSVGNKNIIGKALDRTDESRTQNPIQKSKSKGTHLHTRVVNKVRVKPTKSTRELDNYRAQDIINKSISKGREKLNNGTSSKKSGESSNNIKNSRIATYNGERGTARITSARLVHSHDKIKVSKHKQDVIKTLKLQKALGGKSNIVKPSEKKATMSNTSGVARNITKAKFSNSLNRTFTSKYNEDGIKNQSKSGKAYIRSESGNEIKISKTKMTSSERIENTITTRQNAIKNLKKQRKNSSSVSEGVINRKGINRRYIGNQRIVQAKSNGKINEARRKYVESQSAKNHNTEPSNRSNILKAQFKNSPDKNLTKRNVASSIRKLKSNEVGKRVYRG